MDLQLAATVYTDELDAVQQWLGKYFGFDTHVDWIDAEHKAGKVICKRDGIEIMVCGLLERSAEIQLLVNSIEELCEQFQKDSVQHHVDRDAGERPIIHFPRSSPFTNFVIEEVEFARPGFGRK